MNYQLFFIIFAGVLLGNLISVIIIKTLGKMITNFRQYRQVEQLFMTIHGKKGKVLLKTLKKNNLVDKTGNPIAKSGELHEKINKIFLKIVGKTLKESLGEGMLNSRGEDKPILTRDSKIGKTMH